MIVFQEHQLAASWLIPRQQAHQEAMGKDLLRQRQARRHQHARPVHCKQSNPSPQQLCT